LGVVARGISKLKNGLPTNLSQLGPAVWQGIANMYIYVFEHKALLFR